MRRGRSLGQTLIREEKYGSYGMKQQMRWRRKIEKNVESLWLREGSHEGETLTPVMNVAKKYDDRLQFTYRMKSASKRFNIINIIWKINFLKEDIFDVMSLTNPWHTHFIFHQVNAYLYLNSNIIIGEGNGNPFQYSCLENPTDKGAWWATVHGVAKSRTWLSD